MRDLWRIPKEAITFFEPYCVTLKWNMRTKQFRFRCDASIFTFWSKFYFSLIILKPVVPRDLLLCDIFGFSRRIFPWPIIIGSFWWQIIFIELSWYKPTLLWVYLSAKQSIHFNLIILHGALDKTAKAVTRCLLPFQLGNEHPDHNHAAAPIHIL